MKALGNILGKVLGKPLRNILERVLKKPLGKPLVLAVVALGVALGGYGAFYLWLTPNPATPSLDATSPTTLATELTPRLGVAVAHPPYNLTVTASGEELPAGSGTVAQGAAIYAQKCASCHGSKAQGRTAMELVGGGTGAEKEKAVGSYWQYAPTLFDYIRRAMPPEMPNHLSDEEVYALSGFILHLNGLVEGDAIINKQTLAAIQMPNRNGFVPIWKP